MGASFGPILFAALESGGSISSTDLARARRAADEAGERLDQALVGLGLLSEAERGELLERLFGVEVLGGDEMPAEPVLPELLSPRYLLAASVLPVRADTQMLILAMVDPFDDFASSALALKTGLHVRRKRIARAEFAIAYASLYGVEAIAAELAEVEPAEAQSGDIDVLRDAASGAPVIRFVQQAIASAVAQGASDIHLRPTRVGAEMMFRVDGELVPQTAPDGRSLASIVSRLKILANLDISERRLPQDGRIRSNVAGRPVDIRLSTMPHVYGEGAVLRLLSRELAAGNLSELGFSSTIDAGLARLFSATDGLVLITGPTGSGKSTTLHAALKQLIRPGLNVVTIEDPVEYRVDGAAQIQIDEKLGLTFPRVLRSLLRQDPDIILVGEIRDAETARIAVQAALTGHLVLATLHTNSAPAAVPRLMDMGVEPYLLAAVLRGVLAQRLVRKPGGGRVAVGELALLDAALTERLATGATDTPLRERLAETGYRPLIEDARQRVANGDIDEAELRGLADVSL